MGRGTSRPGITELPQRTGLCTENARGLEASRPFEGRVDMCTVVKKCLMSPVKMKLSFVASGETSSLSLITRQSYMLSIPEV